MYVRPEDVGRADTSALVVAETVLQEVQVGRRASDRIEFAINASSLDSRARYVVRVHVDVDADGRVGIGDYVSTISHPVKVGNGAATLLIPVKRVS